MRVTVQNKEVQNDSKWCWKMDYCKNNGLAPAQKEAWDAAEEAYNKLFPQSTEIKGCKMENKVLTKILDNFDYETARAYMVLTKWEWYDQLTGEMEVPSIKQLKSTAKTILLQSYETCECVQIGGLVAICNQTKYGKYAGLFFRIAASFDLEESVKGGAK